MNHDACSTASAASVTRWEPPRIASSTSTCSWGVLVPAKVAHGLQRRHRTWRWLALDRVATGANGQAAATLGRDED